MSGVKNICAECLKVNEGFELKDGVVIVEVNGISVKELYRVYTNAVEEASEYWKDNFIVYQDTNDYQPFIFELLITDNDVDYYYDIPWSSDNGMCAARYNAERIDLLEGAPTVFNVTDYDDYLDPNMSEEEYLEYLEEQGEDIDYDDEEQIKKLLKKRKEKLKEQDDYEEEIKNNPEYNSFCVKEFSEIIEELLDI